ncbi:MAG: dihydroneopterin aldolase [bacterium]|nr:dihydroneopterin aldolase [Candidatus Limimorpha caballi]MCQ2316191.1 dihydroneopterin aldolase [Bacteroidales bacterium]
MALISIEKMEFYAYHGCFEEERKIGTWFNVDLSLEVDTSKAEKSDNLEDTVNYQSVYQVVKEQMMMPSHLLENVARRILDAIGRQFPAVSYAWVKVKKMNPPLGGVMESVSVEIEM